MGKDLADCRIYVIAGTNGAGKSSVAGEAFLAAGSEYFNPDEATRRILQCNRGLSLQEANSAAWRLGKGLLERAIAERATFAFETTLGGRTITSLLEQAASSGIDVRIWYVGLSSPELHIQRVRSRVARGGHDIPEEKIRERYHQSRLNLIRLLPHVTELLLYDNSEEADPSAGARPRPKLLLHLFRGEVLALCSLAEVPDWAKPIMVATIRRGQR